MQTTKTSRGVVGKDEAEDGVELGLHGGVVEAEADGGDPEERVGARRDAVGERGVVGGEHEAVVGADEGGGGDGEGVGGVEREPAKEEHGEAADAVAELAAEERRDRVDGGEQRHHVREARAPDDRRELAHAERGRRAREHERHDHPQHAPREDDPEAVCELLCDRWGSRRGWSSRVVVCRAVVCRACLCLGECAVGGDAERQKEEGADDAHDAKGDKDGEVVAAAEEEAGEEVAEDAVGLVDDKEDAAREAEAAAGAGKLDERAALRGPDEARAHAGEHARGDHEREARPRVRKEERHVAQRARDQHGLLARRRDRRRRKQRRHRKHHVDDPQRDVPRHPRQRRLQVLRRAVRKEHHEEPARQHQHPAHPLRCMPCLGVSVVLVVLLVVVIVCRLALDNRRPRVVVAVAGGHQVHDVLVHGLRALDHPSRGLAPLVFSLWGVRVGLLVPLSFLHTHGKRSSEGGREKEKNLQSS